MIPNNYGPSKDPRAQQLAQHLRDAHGLAIRGDEGIALLRHWHDQDHQRAAAAGRAPLGRRGAKR